MDLKLEDMEEKVAKFEEVVCEKEVKKDDCSRCSEVEEKIKKAEARCVELELDIEKKKSEYEVLEAKFRALEIEKLAIEDDLKGLKRKNGELNELTSCGKEREGEGIVDLTGEIEEVDQVTELAIENHVLQCEKKRAESEVEVWKGKCTELQLQVLQLEKSLMMGSGEGALNGKAMPDMGIMNFRTSLADLQTKDRTMELSGEGFASVSPVNGVPELQTRGTPYNGTPSKCTSSGKGGKRGRQVRKHLAFDRDESPCKKMVPSTPAGARPGSFTIINICDSDDEPDTLITMPSLANAGTGKPCISTVSVLEATAGSGKHTCKDNAPFTPIPKRRKTGNIVTSDSENDDDDDDNVPISELKRMRLQKSHVGDRELKGVCIQESHVGDRVTPRRRRLATLRQSEGKNGLARILSGKTIEDKHCQATPTTGDFEDDESEEAGSDSEADSMRDFIVDSSDVSDGDDTSRALQNISDDSMDGDDTFGESHELSDDNVAFDKIISKFQRSKGHKMKWEFEADMLAAFGKDPELCMKAVCALYRQQTSEEKISKESLCYNGRGFSKFDAYRGSMLAEFLTDGEPKGDLKKSVKELLEYDSKGVEQCRKLATHYSKQLFEIYINKEDPSFLPS